MGNMMGMNSNMNPMIAAAGMGNMGMGYPMGNPMAMMGNTAAGMMMGGMGGNGGGMGRGRGGFANGQMPPNGPAGYGQGQKRARQEY